jgi:DNA invertase Pin-like site-specific DNA recombinase
MISIRTKEGLARAKARGVKLGGENEQSRANKAEADKRAQALRPILYDIVDGHSDLSATAIAAELNRRKVHTLRPGSQWHAQTVIRIMRRLGMDSAEAAKH